jgi:hypothetical protein
MRIGAPTPAGVAFAIRARPPLKSSSSPSTAGAPMPTVASDLRKRWMARACNCETRDSLTPISAPICFIVTSR